MKGVCFVFVLFEPKAGTVRLIETLTQPPHSLVFLSRDTTQPPRAKVWASPASTFLGFPYLVSLHSLHGPRSGLTQPPHSLISLSCVTTQPPQTKVLVGPYDFKFKIGDNPGLKLPLWPEFFNLMQYHHTSNTTSSSS